MKKTVIRVLLATLGAFAFVAAFPPFGCRLAILPAVLMLLLAVHGLAERPAFWLAFWHGMVAYGIALSWFWNIFAHVAVGLYAILAFFVGLFAVGQSMAERRGWSPWAMALFTATSWTGIEFFRSELFVLDFPWMTPGVALGPNFLLPWVGVYGVSFLVVMAVALLTKRPTRIAGLVGCLLIVALQSLSRVDLKSEDEQSIRFAALQYEGVSFDVYRKATETLDPGVQLVLWPEEAAPYDVRANKADMAALSRLVGGSQRVLVLGTQTRPAADHWFNTALTLDATGVLGEHYKNHPVHLFDDGTPGKTALPVKTPLGVIGTPICFDNDYQGVVRKMTLAGAEFFAVPSMDAESWGEKQHWQHAELFRLRACENARWMLVCPSSGMTQLIDPYGNRWLQLDPMKQGVMTGVLRKETRLTFFTRYGWLTPWFLLGFAIVLWGRLLLTRPRIA
jgi:apolipoprotein N-acyltransferase